MTESDYHMITYFWREKGDLERWAEWYQKTPEFERTCPALVHAWRNYKASVAILGAVIDGLEYEVEND